MNWLLPEYLADALPAEAAQIERLRRSLLDHFRLHGYEHVMPPLMEYLESLLTGTGHDLDLRTFKLVDQLSGRSMGVRADITPLAEGFVGGLDNGLRESALSLPGKAGGLQRIADVPIYFADALVRRAGSLQQTRDAVEPVARIHPETLDQLAVSPGARVKVKQGQGEAVLVACADALVPPGCVRVAAAHAATASLGEMFGPINVERA